jgi:putative hydrolase of the HAD superfamily
MKAIKNIIFDLGGIFLNLNYSLTRDLFIEYGVKNFDELFTQHHANTLFEDLEMGLITSDDFYETFRKETKINLTNEEIKTAWNAMLVSFTPERIQWLKEVKTRYRIYLFSNTNAIHYDAIMELYKRDLGTEDFNELFIKPYYSHEMGLRKPYPESFLHITNEQGLNIEETLFIDDTIKNIESANQLGLQTIHLLAPRTLLDLEL